MNRLSREARDLIDAARGQHEPSPHEQRSVRRAIRMNAPLSAVAACVLSQTAPALASSAVTGLNAAFVVKWLLGGLLIGSLGMGTLTAVAPAKPVAAPAQLSSQRLPIAAHAAPPAHSDLRPEAPAPAPAPEPKIAPPRAPAAVTSLASTRAAEPPVEAPSAVGSAGFAAPATPASANRSSLGDGAAIARPLSADELLLEARALRDAQRALSEGRARDALVLLERQSQRFAGGLLNEERSAARLLALCALGQPPRSEIEQFLQRSAKSPLAPRVRSACGLR
ncbi:MAG: hypothetical protein ACOY0T_28160 [Myxococcota bacterium]